MMESQVNGIGQFPPIEASKVDSLMESIRAAGGLLGTLDCRSKVFVVSEEELSEVIVPLCSWFRGLAEALSPDSRGEAT